MNLEEVMLMVKREVDTELQRFFSAKRKDAERLLHPRGVRQFLHPGGGVFELIDQVADMTLRGGKRIRPFLCWVGYRAVIARSEATRQSRANARTQGARSFASAQDDNLMQTMLGLELFQTFAIIHDDIMDADKTRRGGPTIHEQSGVNIGILAGDLALAWADELIHNAKCQMINDKWNAMKEEVIYGQTLDISLKVKPFLGKGLTLTKQKVDELKTAYYSVVRPLQIGSSLAFKDSLSERLSLLKTWERYGVAVGKLFQLRDDVLDGSLMDEAFRKEAKKLQEKALETLRSLEAPDEVKQLLIDFIRFVQNRKS